MIPIPAEAPTLDRLPNITVGPIWIGSLVNGWQFCCSKALGPRCGPSSSYPTEREAWERASDHFNLHEMDRGAAQSS